MDIGGLFVPDARTTHVHGRVVKWRERGGDLEDSLHHGDGAAACCFCCLRSKQAPTNAAADRIRLGKEGRKESGMEGRRRTRRRRNGSNP